MPKQPPRPTNSELEILRILWDAGPATVRDVHGQLKLQRETGYTTVLKLLQIMHEKGLVIRDESRRSHVYQARYRAEQTQKQLVKDLLQRAFSGSADKLVMQALSAKRVSAEELATIRRMLDEIDGGAP